MKKTLTLLFLLVAAPGLAAAERPVARTLVALIDTRDESTPRMNSVHRFLEMPANHLGYDIQYYPVNQPLPPLGDDVAGIVLWFNIGNEVPNPGAYLDWLLKAQAQGKKLLIIENGGIGDEHLADPVIREKWNHVLVNLGIEKGKNWVPITYKSRIEHIDKDMVGFERELGPVLPAFTDTHVIPGRATSYLRVFIDSEEPESYDLVVHSPGGGYVAQNYAVYQLIEGDETKLVQWIINPFLFLRAALDIQPFPVPDVTTLNGRRIFYSHIDGDGWNNLTEIVAYSQNKTLSSEVILKEILAPYSDFAFSVGLITSEVDASCFGVPGSERVAREIYALPNVEASSHTHSHPLYWQYFADYTPKKEKPLLERYPSPPKLSFMDGRRKEQASQENWSSFKPAKKPRVAEAPLLGRNDVTEEEALEEYHTPRSYACAPFSIKDEIIGSVERIRAYLPPGKEVKLVQWSGDTSPFEEALAVTRKAGLYNINGGDSRFDRDYPSYSYVAPIGVQIGKERQIYSSNSNENTYTNLWTGPFFGFRNLQSTLENTEHPRRVKPANVYFHMYSGQKEASLNALRENMNYARTQPFIPVTASTYAAIANGFYSARIVPEGEGVWKIKDRGALQTLRLDDANYVVVDAARSRGILGWRHARGSLYIALDPAEKEPRLAVAYEATASRPYLVESSWMIDSLAAGEASLSFTSQGYGQGVMVWQMPQAGRYTVTATKRGKAEILFTETFETKERGELSFSVPSLSAGVPLSISITRSSHV